MPALFDNVLIRYYQLQEYKPGADIVVVYSFFLKKRSLHIDNSETIRLQAKTKALIMTTGKFIFT